MATFALGSLIAEYLGASAVTGGVLAEGTTSAVALNYAMKHKPSKKAIGVAAFRSVFDPIGTGIDVAAGTYGTHNENFTKTEVFLNLALDYAFGGLGYQVAERSSKMASQAAAGLSNAERVAEPLSYIGKEQDIFMDHVDDLAEHLDELNISNVSERGNVFEQVPLELDRKKMELVGRVPDPKLERDMTDILGATTMVELESVAAKEGIPFNAAPVATPSAEEMFDAAPVAPDAEEDMELVHEEEKMEEGDDAYVPPPKARATFSEEYDAARSGIPSYGTSTETIPMEDIEFTPTVGSMFALNLLQRYSEPEVEQMLSRMVSAEDVNLGEDVADTVVHRPIALLHNEPGMYRLYAVGNKSLIMVFNQASTLPLKMQAVGEWTGVGSFGLTDMSKRALAAAEEALAEHPGRHLYMTGHSMGAGTAAQVASRLQNLDRLDKIVLFNPNTSAMMSVGSELTSAMTGTQEQLSKKIVAFVNTNDSIPSASIPFGTVHGFETSHVGLAAHDMDSFVDIFDKGSGARYMGELPNSQRFGTMLKTSAYSFGAGQAAKTILATYEPTLQDGVRKYGAHINTKHLHNMYKHTLTQVQQATTAAQMKSHLQQLMVNEHNYVHFNQLPSSGMDTYDAAPTSTEVYNQFDFGPPPPMETPRQALLDLVMGSY